ncbi:MAG: GNAT family N-acetyltransferase [Phycisphaeraceae bacterium]
MDIRHEPDDHRFVIDLGDDKAMLNYKPHDGSLNFYFVYVPPEHRNKGIAAILVTHGFEHARAQGLKVVPGCPYVAHEFLTRFPKYMELVKEEV